jgi:hypothetical protein
MLVGDEAFGSHPDVGCRALHPGDDSRTNNFILTTILVVPVFSRPLGRIHPSRGNTLALHSGAPGFESPPESSRKFGFS